VEAGEGGPVADPHSLAGEEALPAKEPDPPSAPAAEAAESPQPTEPQVCRNSISSLFPTSLR